MSESTAASEGWTLKTLLDELAPHGEAPALIEVEGESLRTLSYASLSQRVRALASGLMRLGCAPGEPIALVAPNGFDWVVARLAIGAVGALAVALDDLATEAELRSAIADSGCRRVLTSVGHVVTLRAIEPQLDLIVLGNEPSDGARSWTELFGAPPAPLPLLSSAMPAMLVYTSGATGEPKGFVLTYANLFANLRALMSERLVGPDDRVLLPLPLHHVYPFELGLLAPLCAGAAVVFPEAVGGREIMQAILAARVSAMIGVPRLYAALTAGIEARATAAGTLGRALFHGSLGVAIALRRRCRIDVGRWLFRSLRQRIGPRLRLLVSGGARLEPEILWPLAGLGFEVRSGYGLAETASIFTGNLPGRERLGSEGWPFQGGSLRIAETDEYGVGEIQLRGPNVFAGYRRNPEANRAAFTVDGWFRTGDLGRVDADGFLYVSGRRSETLVLGGGKKVQPEELEKIYGESPYIREIAVLEREGRLVALVLPDLAAIRTSPSMRIDEAIRVALVSRAQSLPSYQRLAGFALVREPLPRTRLGKYRRFRLRALYEQALAGTAKAAPRALTADDEALLARPAARCAYELIKARYSDKPVSLDASPLLDLGIDSLEWIALSMILEERLGVHLAETAVAKAVTVRDLLCVAASAVGAREESAGALAIEPLASDDARWLAPTGPGLRLFGLVAYGVNRLLMRLLFRLRVEGAGNLPLHGPYVLVSNHASDLDPLLLAAALSYRQARRLYWSGEASRLFSRRWRHPLLRALHVFPLDERAPVQALALAEATLARGNDLAWFPESWRSPDGKLQRFLPGIGRVLERAQVPAVPVYIAGSFDAMPRDRAWPRLRPVRVLFGPPLAADAIRTLAVGEGPAHLRITNALHEAVTALGARSGADARA